MSGDAARKKNSQGTLKALEPSARGQWKATSPRGGHGQSRENVAQTILRRVSSNLRPLSFRRDSPRGELLDFRASGTPVSIPAAPAALHETGCRRQPRRAPRQRMHLRRVSRVCPPKLHIYRDHQTTSTRKDAQTIRVPGCRRHAHRRSFSSSRAPEGEAKVLRFMAAPEVKSNEITAPRSKELLQSPCSVRISFAKTYPLPKRASGGKPVQGHGSVELTNPAQGEFASKKCSNMF
jgi:hypothetical protein